MTFYILSTVATRSPIGQGLSCFCAKIIIGVDEYSTFQLFGQLLDGLLEHGWDKVSEVDPAKAEFHSSVREQRQKEVNGSRSCVPINNVFAFCNESGFRSRPNMHKVSIMVSRNHLGLLMIFHVCCFKVFQLTALVVRGSSESHPVFTMSLDMVAINHGKVFDAVACVQDFVRHRLFTQRNFFNWNQHVEDCRCCRRCCSAQLLVWLLESNWIGGWPRDSRS